MSAKPIERISACHVVFDFDNTITDFDVLDDIVSRFSINKKWVKLENAWLKKKIGSEECLRGQLKGVRVTKADLLRYLDKIKVSLYFQKVINLLRKHGARVEILSDNFAPFIRRILRKNRVSGFKLYANNISFRGNRLVPSFPHRNVSCFSCAHCKTNNLPSERRGDKILIYIGDGNSDICPAKKADIVFAKGTLARHFEKSRLDYRKFNSIREIYNFFRSYNVSKTKNN